MTEGRPLPDHPVLRSIFEAVPEAVWKRSHGQDVASVPATLWKETAEAAHRAGFEMLVDVTTVDRVRTRRSFEVVASLLSLGHRLRLRMITEVSEDDPRIASLCSVFPGANFFEREAYDMFGVVFDDHPDMTRILMPDDWEGHPLRKDFAVGWVPVQFKAANQVR